MWSDLPPGPYLFVVDDVEDNVQDDLDRNLISKKVE